MLLLYGKKFTEQWAGISPQSLKECWAEELAGYTGPELRAGLEGCKSRDWPPTLPEFMKLCRPTLDCEAAFHEAVNGLAERKQGRPGLWSHPAIYWAAQKVGPFDIANQGYAVLAGRWKRALVECFAQTELPDIPIPRAALPEPGATHVSRAEATASLEKLQATGILRPKIDHRRWIKKILENEKDGVIQSYAAVQYAKQAQRETMQEEQPVKAIVAKQPIKADVTHSFADEIEEVE